MAQEKKQKEEKELTFKDFNNAMSPTWCPGCGDFGIFMALKQALVSLKIPPHQIFQVWGIGCSGNMSNWVNVYGVHGLHGRALPVATAAKLVNPKIPVIVEGGDGDGYGIGIGHFIHAMRRNLDITYIVHNNQIYGLTTGQTSPTSDHGFKTKSTPCGVIERPINPLALALSSEATYIARGFSGDVNHLKVLIEEGIKHRGFALIDVLQPCVTFNYQNTYDWFRERVYTLDAVPGYDVKDKKAAFERSLEWGPKIPVGVFYKEERAIYSDEFDHLEKDEAVVDHDISAIDVMKTLKSFA